MKVETEIFFDLSSPWTYIAFHNFRRWVEETGANAVWRPFLVGGVFNAVNQSVYAGRENPDNAKFRWSFIWLKEWAQEAGLPLNFPSPYHPLKSVQAMRFACTLEEDQPALLRFVDAAFAAYFDRQQNIDDLEILAAIADGCGLDGAALAAQSQTQATKDKLRANTEEAIERGAYGSPTFFVNREWMYFGNDQLPLVRQRIALLSNGV
jgi:2-hydroxychromene-2-carboxylate isomerase